MIETGLLLSPPRAGRSMRPARLAVFGGLVMLAGAVPAAAADSEIGAAATSAALAQYYDARSAMPSWFGGGQRQAADGLVNLLATSSLDGIVPRLFNLRALQKAVRRAGNGNPTDIQRADRMLNDAFGRYLAALRQNVSTEWQFIDREVAPGAPQAAALLQQAAASGSLGSFVERMPWMHESYPGLRMALADAERRGDRTTAARLRINLERIRGLPAGGRYVLVNTAAQRLYMYEDGRVVDWMRVVVGKPAQPTPMMGALIRYTAVNPYWNLPNDLVAERIAPNVVKLGLPYLKAKGYVVLSDWGDDPARIDPAKVDWKAVAAGKTEVRVRQNPGPANAMGRMKFMFPNKAGVYLHDTPNKELLGEDARLFSAGCVRLEDAPRLAKWLYGRSLRVTKGMKPEQHVDLDPPVPVYLAYLTAVPSGNQTVYYEDIYGRDRARLAAASVNQIAAR